MQIVPSGVRAGLVVADARVNGDSFAVDLDDETLDALQQESLLIDEVGRQPRRTFGHRHDADLVDVLEEEPGRGLHLDLDDRRDRRLADLPRGRAI